jgi:dihydroorotate dehydrogenase
MLWAGASAVEVGTSYFISGAKVFGEIAGQFVNLS